MKIEDILKEQGELYKNLTSSETTEECNETIEKPKLTQVEKVELKKTLEEELELSKKGMKNLTGISSLGGVLGGVALYKIFQEQSDTTNLAIYMAVLIFGLVIMSFGIGGLYYSIKDYRKYKNLIKSVQNNTYCKADP